MTYQEQIDDIMDNFDFEGVRIALNCPFCPVYDNDCNVTSRHKWTMATDEGLRIPTVLDLRKLARKHLNYVAEKDAKENIWWVRSGPFMAINRYGKLSLLFVGESWESGDDDD